MIAINWEILLHLFLHDIYKSMFICMRSSSLRLPLRLSGKESACNARTSGDTCLIPGLGIFPWRRECLLTPIFLPGEFHGQRSLVGLQSTGSQRVRHYSATNTFSFSSLFTCRKPVNNSIPDGYILPADSIQISGLSFTHTSQ